MKNQEKDYAKDQAQAQFNSIQDMVKELKEAQNEEEQEKAQERIQEDPLSVQVRSGWCAMIDKDTKPEEFEILLCTGGPACRIIGELDEYLRPERAVIQYQDWGTPWTEYRLTYEQEQIVIEYCQQFYFGE